MKIRLLAILLLAGVALAQTTPTPNLGIPVPDVGSNNWGPVLITDFNLLDGFLSGAAPLPQITIANSLAIAGGTPLTTTNHIGNGSLVLQNVPVLNSPTLVTPVLGVATGTSLALSAGFSANLTAVVNAGDFSNITPHWYLSSIIGSISPASEVTPVYTTALLGAIVTPPTAADLNIMGVTGIVNSQCNSFNETICNTVGGYFNARAGVAGAAVWGTNSITWDVPGAANTHLTGNEIDVNVFDAPTKVYGLQITGNVANTATIPNNSYAIHINPVNAVPGYGYYNGVFFSDGSIGSTAYWVPALAASGANKNSASVGWSFYDSASANHMLAQLVDSQGIMNIAQGIKITGAAPTCTFTSGFGTGPALCTLDTGSTNMAGHITITTGTGSPAATGTITLTFTNFSNAFGVNPPACQYSASDASAGQWAGVPAFKDKLPTVTNDLFTWTNAAATLTASTAYKIVYHCDPQ